MSGPREVICRCEDVTREDIEKAFDELSCEPVHLKHISRAGMGICGGRTCRRLLERLIAEHTNAAPVGAFTFRLPARAVSVQQLAESPLPEEVAEGIYRVDVRPCQEHDEKPESKPAPTALGAGR